VIGRGKTLPKVPKVPRLPKLKLPGPELRRLSKVTSAWSRIQAFEILAILAIWALLAMQDEQENGMPSRERRRPLILVVDDDPGVRGPLQKFLAMHGFDILAADSVDSALDRLGHHQIQGAVIDLRFPRGSGREVVLSIPPPTPVIIFSAVPDQSAGLEQIRPNTRLILKPFSLVMLVETLHGMIEAAARNPRMTVEGF
jgi:CheY-like chemotaxis protein